MTARSEVEQTRTVSTGPFVALRNRRFRWYWISGFGATGAEGVKQFALAWLVLDLTGSVGQLGLVVFLQGVPMSLVALFGGVLADRYDKRTLLICSQSVTMTNLFVLSVLTLTGAIEVWQVYVSAVGLGAMQSLTMPARQAFIRTLVAREEMMNAVALNSMQQQSSRIIWPSVAGGLIALLGVGATLSVSAACSVFGVFCLLMVRGTVREAPVRRESPLREVAQGIRYTFSTPVVANVMSLGLGVAMLIFAYMAMAPGFARAELDLSSAQAGLFIMGSGIGAMLGSATLLVLNVENRLRLFMRMCGSLGICLALIALNPFVPAAFLLMGLYGFSNSMMGVSAVTLLQTHAAPNYLGRVISLFGIGTGLGYVIALPIGVVGDMVGLRAPLLVLGLAFVAASVWVGLVRPVRAATARVQRDASPV